MKLTQEEIVDLDGFFTTLSKTQNVDVEKLISLYNYFIGVLEGLSSVKGRSRRYLHTRVRSQIDGYFSNKKTAGERYIYIPFGQLGRTRDWAYKLFGHVEEEVDHGNIDGLVENERIMSMEVNGKKVPISQYSSYEFEKVYVDVDNVVEYSEPGEGRVEFKKMVVTDGSHSFEVIGFGLGALLPDLPSSFDLAYNLTINYYRGQRKLQLQALDLVPS